MAEPSLLFIALVFTLAGVVKGVIGLGLPTISMGLLATVMSPLHAATILILPSFATNVWQMAAGPALRQVLRRLWPMMVAVCIGTWAGIGLMTGTTARFGTALLGFALALYAILGLTGIRLSVPSNQQPILGPIVGLLTGLTTAATGVFVIPAVPYLQAIGLEREELVQALGLSFTVSTLALMVNVGLEGAPQLAMAGETITGLLFACVGMWLGQLIRQRMSQERFRTTFFIMLLLLGLYLAVQIAR